MEFAVSIASRPVTSHVFHDLVGIIFSTTPLGNNAGCGPRSTLASLASDPAWLSQIHQRNGTTAQILSQSFLEILRVRTQDVCKSLLSAYGLLWLIRPTGQLIYHFESESKRLSMRRKQLC
ncbi:hypothetical protein HDV62DRAFT_113483 [Trichoderma sp. SZMC 28011]